MKTTLTHPNEYNPSELEPRWRDRWENTGNYLTPDTRSKPKFYCLDYFPYPSGEGLHVGHCRNYVPTDVISRFKRMQGIQVLHPMGWDAFGEPAEQNAIRNNVTPRVTTDRNTANYKRQMMLIGTSYDWNREIDSSDPSYYRWTQWMFLRMYRQGLAYRDTHWQWWCPTCATTLSSHEIVGDKCWRGHVGVTKKEIPAWFFKISAYADELISGLETVDWPESIVQMQRNWIGRSEGVEIDFETASGEVIPVFTTRPDTLFGVTFFVLAPEHPLVDHVTTAAQQIDVKPYIDKAIRSSEIDRIAEGREITGVFTGGYVTQPLSQEKIPVFVADYVLPTYGTGAVMGVPGHDLRDYEFAVKYGLEIRQVIAPVDSNPDCQGAFVDPGVMINSGPYSGCDSQVGGERIVADLANLGIGRRTVNYRMRDWLISRQRYWGTPIPIVYCEACGEIPLPDGDLPILLPEMEDFKPDGTGRSPLARVPEFFQTRCPVCGGPARRETDTMGGFACSSWYFLRFANPNFHDGPFDPDAITYWMPVDLYVGGSEHAVLHLMYARFWTKFLADEGLVDFREPFTKLINQGQLLGPDGQRMSKSRGNVIIPDEIVDKFGADALRLYVLFIAPFDANVEWNADGIIGIQRFLHRVWNLYPAYWAPGTGFVPGVDVDLEAACHRTIQAVTERIDTFRFNTMVSALMEFVNLLYDRVRAQGWKTATFQNCLETLILLLAPAAPFIAEELWEFTGHPYSVHQQDWPEWEAARVQHENAVIPVQVNGRVRGKIEIEIDAPESTVFEIAKADPGIRKFITAQEFTRVVYVPGKILNIVTKEDGGELNV